MSNPLIGMGDRRRIPHTIPFILVSTDLGRKRHIKWVPYTDQRHREGNPEEVLLNLR